jgi:CobQ-like glutamine amidotransferase family enzyme
MSRYSITICHLYPREMNIYGDHGNLLTLIRRAEWRGVDVTVEQHHPGGTFPASCDLILGGGGQDSGQLTVQNDLPRIADSLRSLIDHDVPALVVCGTYQLFGNYFKTVNNERIEGLGIFDMHTVGGEQRMIGNIVTKNSEFGDIIGYENHSGLTWLGDGAAPFAEVVLGAGNNGADKTEGARYRNAIGTYLHGPLLPKNPAIADFLLACALRSKYGEAFDKQSLVALEGTDELADKARSVAAARPR